MLIARVVNCAACGELTVVPAPGDEQPTKDLSAGQIKAGLRGDQLSKPRHCRNSPPGTARLCSSQCTRRRLLRFDLQQRQMVHLFGEATSTQWNFASSDGKEPARLTDVYDLDGIGEIIL